MVLGTLNDVFLHVPRNKNHERLERSPRARCSSKDAEFATCEFCTFYRTKVIFLSGDSFTFSVKISSLVAARFASNVAGPRREVRESFNRCMRQRDWYFRLIRFCFGFRSNFPRVPSRKSSPFATCAKFENRPGVSLCFAVAICVNHI